MKSIYLILLGAVYFMYGCSKESIQTYDENTSKRFIYFVKSETDSTDVSFFSYPGESVIEFPIVVKSSGFSTQDEEYKIVVLNEYSTAIEGEDFKLPTNFIFKGGATSDTCYVKLHYSSKLDDSKVRIVLQLESQNNFESGPSAYQTAVIWFHNNIVKPNWWTSSVTSYYLGDYSEKKYRLFNQVVGVDLTDASNSLIRHYALIFKEYLNTQKISGNTIYEENGTEMTVIAGGQ